MDLTDPRFLQALALIVLLLAVVIVVTVRARRRRREESRPIRMLFREKDREA